MAVRIPVRRISRRTFQLLGAVSTTLCGAWAEALFRTPPRQTKSSAELDLLASATRHDIVTNVGRVATFRWGTGERRVLLVHGWGGHAGRLSHFVGPLLSAGFTVVAFDAPAHGESGGVWASVPEFCEAIAALGAEIGPFTGLVAHSAGAMASVLALRKGLTLDRAVFLAPLAEPDRYSRRFARFYGLPPCISESIRVRYEARYQLKWEDLRVADQLGAFATRLLVFHDRRDICVPIHDGAAIVKAWRGARLVKTGGLGHHRILSDPEVVQRAVEFLQNARPAFAPGRGEGRIKKVS